MNYTPSENKGGNFLNIKEGVSELFESNPELANIVYETLDFNKNFNNRISVSQEGSDGFGYVLGLFNSTKERIGKIVYRSKTYLKEKGYPIINELHLGFEETYQGKGYFQDALIELLNYDDVPIFISTNRVINNNVFIAIKKLDINKLNVLKIEDGYIITLNNKITPQQKQQAQELYSQYLNTIFPDSKVKNIVYHGSGQFGFDKFSKEKLGESTKAGSAKLGFFFSNNLENSFSAYTANIEKDVFFGDDGSVEDTEGTYALGHLDGIIDDLDTAKSFHTDTYIYIIVDWLKNEPIKYYKEKRGDYGNRINISENEYSKAKESRRAFLLKERETLINKDSKNRVYNVLLNSKTLKEFDDKGNSWREDTYVNRIKQTLEENKEGLVIKNTYDPLLNDVYVVFEPEQIHILGSKQDIEGFKEFVNNYKQQNNNLYNIQSNTFSQDYRELENLTTQFRMNERGYMANVPEADFRELVKRVSKLFNGEIKVRKVKSNTSTVIMFKGNKMITPSEITSRQLYNINNKSQDDIKADNKYIETLNYKLIEILKKAGVGVSRVTGLDKLIDAYGEYSPDSLKKTVDGLKELIRISNDIEGTKSLPEEFAHFIIDSLSDTPLVRRLLTVIDNDATIKEILGDSYNEYKRKYNGDRSKLLYEAAGKVLAKHLLKQHQISQDKPYRNILQRTIDFIKSIFRKIDENTLNIVVSETDALYSQFAKDILDEKINKLQSERLSTNRLFNVVKETLSRNKKVINDLITRQLQIRDIRNKLENAVPNSSKELSDVSSPIARNSEKAKSLLNHLNLLLLKNKNNELPESLFLEAMNEIVTFMTSSLEEAKIETETNIADINGNFIATPIETAKKLREVYYFINFISESQKDLQSLLSSIRTESDYDSKSDEIKKAYFDLSTSLSNTIKIYSDISSENNNQSIKLFSGFLKPFYGKKVTIPFGKDKGKEISFEDILKKADQDIS